MGANTSYYVKVLRTHTEWVEVSALHEDDARDEAERLPGVIAANEAVHWSVYESTPEGRSKDV